MHLHLGLLSLAFLLFSTPKSNWPITEFVMNARYDTLAHIGWYDKFKGQKISSDSPKNK